MPFFPDWDFRDRRVATIETDDPDALGDDACAAIEPGAAVERPSTFKTVGKRRDLLRFALTELHRVAPAPADVIALPEGAPLGAITVDVERMHAVPVLRLGLPDRRAAATIPIARR